MGEENIENLWADCMNEDALQNIYQESNLILLGDSNCGK